MEDIRKLLNDFEAEIAPESLAYVLRGLNYALADELRLGGTTAAPGNRRRPHPLRRDLLHRPSQVDVGTRG